MSTERDCTRNGCRQPAAATLTFVYADSSAVLGPLSHEAEPHSYDVCRGHAARLTAPRGWELVRLPLPETVRSAAEDDLLALADVVCSAKAPAGPGQSVEFAEFEAQHAAAHPRPHLYLVE